ncbi:MAG TPA: bi-domain-containing oxidoreductase [Steroidobacteraceae bacterium]|nr:bi-domain-containing oxidoreductase [Steroidobacteraceae bacterium]
MRQILQDLRGGATFLETVPAPLVRANHVLIRTERTLISSGTERMLLEFGQANLLAKARQQPDKVRMVLDKMRSDGVVPTLQAVRGRLEQPVAMGYCNVGRVVEVGEGVSGFAVGDRVASNGKHAEVVCVPQHLCARVPEHVDGDSAVFTVAGAIALQGIRLAAPTLGETVVVTGLGLIGLITVQLLRAQGCRVFGLDFGTEKIEHARSMGAQALDLASGADPVQAAIEYSRGRGVDAVIVTAATESSEPLRQAARMSRKRGRIVLVGVAGIELSRAELYEKELTFQVSCSYGPGRYDPAYEEGGRDYPVGFVRWTAQRNFEAVLDMMADQRLKVRGLITHRFSLERASEAYGLLARGQQALGIVLEYGPAAAEAGGSAPHGSQASNDSRVRIAVAADTTRTPTVGIIGAGNYAGQVLIPAFARTNARLKLVISAQGVSGVQAARRNEIEEAGTDAREVLDDPAIDVVVVATRHDTHASYVLKALAARKHVFVEKPLCLTLAELTEIRAAYQRAHEGGGGPMLMVGFNRRFAPHVERARGLLSALTAPKAFVMTVNAGRVPAEHWTQDRAAGGGRILGEACHFIDLLRHLANAPVVGYNARRLGGRRAADAESAMITLEFADGSLGTIHYLGNGHRSFPKERLEVFCGGRILQLDNFRRLRGFGWGAFGGMRTWRQDKGVTACVQAFVDAARSTQRSPIPFEQLAEVAELTISVDQALAQHC